jgi:hypothetical protein
MAGMLAVSPGVAAAVKPPVQYAAAWQQQQARERARGDSAQQRTDDLRQRIRTPGRFSTMDRLTPPPGYVRKRRPVRRRA